MSHLATAYRVSAATSVDGARLLEICLSPKTHAACTYYILGAIDANGSWMAGLETELRGGCAARENPEKCVKDGLRATATDRDCIPAGTTGGQLRDIMTRWLNRNPKELKVEAAELVRKAMIEAFPCSS
jgi:hypothetical protein